MNRTWKLILTLLVVTILLAGCGSTSMNSSDPQDGGRDYEQNKQFSAEGAANGEVYDSYADNELAVEDDGSGSQEAQGTTQAGKETKAETKEEKLVYTCDLTIETTGYKETMEEVEKQIKAHAGIIESQNESDNDSGWYMDGHTKTYGTMQCTIVVKIPSKNYQAFLKSLEGNGKMTHKSMQVDNITRTYYDTRATIEALEIQEKRLMKMMEEAKTIDDMITVEKRLTEVQTQLNQYKTQLSYMDTQVAYSTVTMTIEEVLEYKNSPEGKKTNTFLQRLHNTLEETVENFRDFMEGLLFFLIRISPYLVVILILWFVTKPIRMYFKRRRQLKKLEKSRLYADSAGKGKKKKALFGKGKAANTDREVKEGDYTTTDYTTADVNQESDKKSAEGDRTEESAGMNSYSEAGTESNVNANSGADSDSVSRLES